MQKIYANNLVPKGHYCCLDCSEEQVIEEKDYLLPCPECGGKVFSATIVLTLSEEEIKEKFNECLKVLAISTYLYEKHNMSEFLNVIAVNLRMLLCDGENTLLNKVIESPMFNKSSENYENNVILPQKLFDNPIVKIPLESFLEQVIVRRPGSRPVTIKKMIRAVANKCGGAHLDTEIHEDYYLASSVSKYYFIFISKYIIKMAGFDYDNMIKEFLGELNAQ